MKKTAYVFLYKGVFSVSLCKIPRVVPAVMPAKPGGCLARVQGG